MINDSSQKVRLISSCVLVTKLWPRLKNNKSMQNNYLTAYRPTVIAMLVHCQRRRPSINKIVGQYLVFGGMSIYLPVGRII